MTLCFDEEEEGEDEEEFIPILEGALVGSFVRRYFDNFGWFDGTVIAQAANVNGEMQYTITYPEDNDREDLNQDLFDEARAYYYQTPQPVLPIQLVRLQAAEEAKKKPAAIITEIAQESSSPPGSPTSSLASASASSSPKQSDSQTDLSACAGCGRYVTSDYTCPGCYRSIHFFCGADDQDGEQSDRSSYM